MEPNRPEMNPHVYGQLIFDKRNTMGERIVSSLSSVKETGYPQARN
jgi:hypothetical protein